MTLPLPPSRRVPLLPEGAAATEDDDDDGMARGGGSMGCGVHGVVGACFEEGEGEWGIAWLVCMVRGVWSEGSAGVWS